MAINKSERHLDCLVTRFEPAAHHTAVQFESLGQVDCDCFTTAHTTTATTLRRPVAYQVHLNLQIVGNLYTPASGRGSPRKCYLADF